MDGLSVHQETGLSLLNGSADVTNHRLLRLSSLISFEGAHLEHFSLFPVQDWLATLIRTEKQSICRIVTCSCNVTRLLFGAAVL